MESSAVNMMTIQASVDANFWPYHGLSHLEILYIQFGWDDQTYEPRNAKVQVASEVE